VHGQGSPTRTVSLSQQKVPPLRCSLCGQALEARWNRGATLEPDDIHIAVDVHRCPTDDVRIIDASALTDDQVIAEAIGRGLMAG
jgi:hypothetical protein